MQPLAQEGRQKLHDDTAEGEINKKVRTCFMQQQRRRLLIGEKLLLLDKVHIGENTN